jgi:hypothetical protein
MTFLRKKSEINMKKTTLIKSENILKELKKYSDG